MFRVILNNLYFFFNLKLGFNVSSFFRDFFFSRLNLHLILFNVIELNYDFLLIFTTFFDLGINKIPFIFKINFLYRNKKKVKVFIMKMLLLDNSFSFRIFLSELFFFILYPRINYAYSSFLNFNLKSYYQSCLNFFFSFSINILTLSYLNRFYNSFDLTTFSNSILLQNVNFDFIIILRYSQFDCFFFNFFNNNNNNNNNNNIHFFSSFYEYSINNENLNNIKKYYSCLSLKLINKYLYFFFKRCVFLIYSFFFRRIC